MIKIELTDKNGKNIADCGAGLPSKVEAEIYLALRNSLLSYNKLIKIFGNK